MVPGTLLTVGLFVLHNSDQNRPTIPCLIGRALLVIALSAPSIDAQPGPVSAQVPSGTSLSTAERLAQMTATFPIVVVTSETFADHFVRQELFEEGPVRDFILGAHVVGTQRTLAVAQVDFVPHESRARMLIVLEGTTNNQTMNYTPQAVIQSTGRYRFQLTKQIEFDGDLFQTWSPAAFMTVRQQNQGAMTPVGGVPVLGPLASMIAITEADRQRPIAEQIAAQRVTQQIAPRFNNEADQQLATLNRLLADEVRSRLERLDLLPARLQTASTTDCVFIGWGLTERRAPLESPAPAPDLKTGVAVLVHESHLNDLLAKAPLRGAELPDTFFDRLQSLATGTSDAPSNPQLATLLFDEQQPVHATIHDGVMEFELRAAFRPVLGPLIPTQRLSFEVRPVLGSQMLSISTLLARVEPLEPTAEPDALSGIAGAAIRQQIEQRLEDVTLPRSIPLPIPELEQPATLAITGLSLENGWLVLTADLSDSAEDCPVLPAPDGWQPH